MRTIITTVGTSIFTNLTKKGANKVEIAEPLALIEDKPYLSTDNFKKYHRDIEGRSKDGLRYTVQKRISKNAKEASAEIKSISLIAQKEQVNVCLICTDTLSAYLAAELIQWWFEHNKVDNVKKISIELISDLRIDCPKLFLQSGLVNLHRTFERLIFDNGISYAPFFILNVTGGYKVVIPYLTILGQINEIPIFYIFEDKELPIWLPQTPIEINYSIFIEYEPIFESLSASIETTWDSYKMQHNLPDMFDNYVEEIVDDNESLCSLNAIGLFFFNRLKNNISLEILKGSNIYGENEGNKRELLDALRELYFRLSEQVKNNQIDSFETLINHIKELGGKDDLRHGENPQSDIFIFKSTDKGQIRLVYQPIFKNRNIGIKLYDYRRGQFDHSAYIQEFKNKYKLKSEFEFTSISIKKQ